MSAPREAHVVSVGAITPVGTSAALSFAAVHARLSRTRLEDGDADASYHRAVVDTLPADLSRVARLRALLASAVDDALTLLPALQARTANFPQTIPLWLALPEGVRSTEVCAERAAGSVALWPIVTLSRGRASGLMALNAAVTAIVGGQHELAMVAGVDVLSDDEGVAELARAGLLLTEDNPWGIVPGEGAAALLLVSTRLLGRLGVPSLGVIVAVAQSSDDAQQRGVPCIGEGLSQACHEVLDKAPQEALAAEIYGDLSGRRARADEWGYSAPRLAQRCRDVTDAQMPALCWGDQGLATGILLVSLALYDGARGHAQGSHLLVWTTSEQHERAAALLGSAPGAPLVVPSRALGDLDREQVEELLSEARFVFGQRTEQRVNLEEQPSSGDAAVVSSEQRLERYVDGLAVMHEAALDACVQESLDASLAYVQLRVLSTGTSLEPLRALLEGLPLSEPAMFAAVHEALSDASGPWVRELSRALVGGAHTAPLLALGLWLCGDLREPVERWESCLSAGAGLLGASFPYALGRLASSEQAVLLEPWLESADPELVEAACLAWLRLDSQHAPRRLWQLRHTEGVQLPLALVCARGQQHALFDALATASPHTIDLALGLLGTAEAAERLLDRLGASEGAALGLHLVTGFELLEQVEHAVVVPDDELTTDELERRRAGDFEVGVERERITQLVATRAVWTPIVESHRRRLGELRTRLGLPLGPAAQASVLQHPRLPRSLKRLCAAWPERRESALDLPRHARARDFARAVALLRVGG